MDGNPKGDHKVAREAEEGLKKRGLSRRGVLNVIKHIGAGIGVSAVIVGRDVIVAFAQQISGVLGSPSATTTISPGTHPPPPPPEFGGEIKELYKDLTPWWPPRVVPPTGSTQYSTHHDRRSRLWRQRHVRRRHTDAGARPDRGRGAALHGVQLDFALLANAGGVVLPVATITRWASASSAESSTGRIPRRTNSHPSARRTRRSARFAATKRLRHFMVRQEPQYAGLHSTAPPVHSTNGHQAWGSSISTASWRRDRSVDAVSVPRSHPNISLDRKSRLQPHH